MILLIDNYDSFTYNLYQYIGELYSDIKVVRNDEITITEIKALNPNAIIISPGPGYPKEAGFSVDVIKEFSGTIPLLNTGEYEIVDYPDSKILKPKTRPLLISLRSGRPRSRGGRQPPPARRIEHDDGGLRLNL